MWLVSNLLAFSAVRRGKANDEARTFHLVVAAAAFHIGHYGARSFCLFPKGAETENLSVTECALVLLMRRNLVELRRRCFAWLNAAERSDAVLRDRIDSDESFGTEDLALIALQLNFHRAMGLVEFALLVGSAQHASEAKTKLAAGANAAAEVGFVDLWWTNTLALHLADDLWAQSMHVLLPQTGGETSP
mgnify:CR=1 FL=1